MYFSFHLGWYCIHSDIVHLENVVVVGGELLKGQNPLSMTKVICQQSLNTNVMLEAIYIYI